MHEPLTVGSVFTGVGLLDIGLHQAGLRHVWMCESDPWRRELLRTRFGVPVHDDIRTLRGQAAADASSRGRSGEGWRGTLESDERTVGADDQGRVPCVDVIAGGFPCKGASSAGNRNGFEHAETALWSEMRRCISEFRPRYVLVENVADILGMAASPGEPPGSLWGTVVGEMAALGYDVRWDCIPSAAVGAPHLRDRVIAVGSRRDDGVPVATGGAALACDGNDAAAAQPACTDEERYGSDGRLADGWADAAGDRDWPAADTTQARRSPTVGPRQQRGVGSDAGAGSIGVAVDWGDYQPAIARWAAIHGPPPAPLSTGFCRVDDGDPELWQVRARVDRSEMRAQRQRLSGLGDGVHVYVGRLAGEYLMGLERQRREATGSP